MPDLTIPHCGTCSAIQARCRGCERSMDNPSMVVMLVCATALMGTTHERTGRPSICTVQGPAQPCAAPELRTGQTKMVTQDPQKRRIAANDDGLLPTVDGQRVALAASPRKSTETYCPYHHCTNWVRVHVTHHGNITAYPRLLSGLSVALRAMCTERANCNRTEFSGRDRDRGDGSIGLLPGRILCLCEWNLVANERNPVRSQFLWFLGCTRATRRAQGRRSDSTCIRRRAIGEVPRPAGWRLLASFMQEDQIETLGLRPLRPILKTVAGISNRRSLAAFLGGTLRADVDVLNTTHVYTDKPVRPMGRSGPRPS